MEIKNIETKINLQVTVELDKEMGSQLSTGLDNRSISYSEKRYKDVALIPLHNLKDVSKWLKMNNNKLLESVPDDAINHYNKSTKIKSFNPITEKECLTYSNLSFYTRLTDSDDNLYDYLFTTNYTKPVEYRASNYRMHFFQVGNNSRVVTYSKKNTERNIHLDSFAVDFHLEIETVKSKILPLTFDAEYNIKNSFEILQEGFKNNIIKSVKLIISDKTNDLEFKTTITKREIETILL